jgi:serine/threonine protein kinase
MAGGELEWKGENDTPLLSHDQTHAIFRDVINGLEYLHHNGIIHRDVKPANLLWTSRDPTKRRIKISDFGVSVLHASDHDEELSKTAGSPAFFAPELCGGDDFDFLEILANNQAVMPPPKSPAGKLALKIGPQIDIWAVGVTLYCITFGKVPFIAPTELKLFQVICKQRYVSFLLIS